MTKRAEICRMTAATGLVALLVAPAAIAEQVPSQQRGLSASTAYLGGGDLDHVNLFNSNLVVRIAIGSPYAVGPSLSWGLSLVYNSTAWDFDERDCVFDGHRYDYAVPVPDPRSNAGAGWMAGLGKLYAPHHEPFNKTPDWQYLAPDGGQHRLHDALHPGHPAAGSQPATWFSRDGTYLRLARFASGTDQCAPPPVNAVTGSACMRLEFPDGTLQEYYAFPVAQDSDWRLTRIRDRFGNFVDVGHSLNLWELTDSTPTAAPRGSASTAGGCAASS